MPKSIFINPQSLPILNIGISGGGGKAVTLPGAMRAFYDAQLLGDVQEIAGTSAGAIMAAFTSVGIPPLVIREKLLSTNMMGLLGNVSRSKGRAGAMRFVTRDGSEMRAFINQTIVDAIKSHLETVDVDLCYTHLQREDREKLIKLKVKINEANPTFTFSDLSLLHQCDPTRFKELNTTMVHHQHGALQICNTMNTPDLNIADAVQASASLPVVLAASLIKVDGEEDYYLDGGAHTNLPDCFKRPGNYEQTLLFAFGQGSKAGPSSKEDRVTYAMHHGHWNEALSHEDIEGAVKEIIELGLQRSVMLSSQNKTLMLLMRVYVHAALQKKVQEKRISAESALKLKEIIHQSLQDTWMKCTYIKCGSKTIEPMLKAQFMKALLIDTQEKIAQTRQVLYHSSWGEQLTQNILPNHLVGFNPDYKITEKKRSDFLKIHDLYPMRTANLHTGNISSFSFKLDRKVLRVMDAIGYADTMAYLINYDLVSDCNPAQCDITSNYCTDVVNAFSLIFEAIIVGSRLDSSSEKLLKKAPLNKRDINWFQTIKEYAVLHPTSPAAFAFSRAIEYKSGLISVEGLFEETYLEAFRHSRCLSMSQSTGHTFFRHKSLETSLETMDPARKKALFKLDVDKPATHTRMGIVRQAMVNLRSMEIKPVTSSTETPSFMTNK